MESKDFFQNILSFGAHGRIQTAESDYEELKTRLEITHKNHEKRKQEINIILKDLIITKKNALKKIRKVKKITSILNVKQREEVEYKLEEKDYSLKKIETSISIGETALNLGKGTLSGIFTGASTAAGSWALVGTWGAASTGTAISSLSGAAATNATLAWFGGGSIATGGLGIAGGTMVIGGVVLVPTVTIMALLQHLKANKKIKQIKEESNEIIKFIDEIESNLVSFLVVEKRAIEISLSISKSLNIFEKIYLETYREIYKYGIFSRFFKWIKYKLFKNPFSDKELEKIASLGKFTGDILKIVDTKIL